ncbi:hypothetical protein AAFF_G00379010 [Aldrovandia affinis]|uniref:Uncharacterized protein n=1 Tax=Aldrovandia affinis TaxID=143900 RepID=A0AAD7SFN6_9TELE|nr:hypothetical protein AAFF_G00379010 [Aldrovandia affinis]
MLGSLQLGAREERSVFGAGQRRGQNSQAQERRGRGDRTPGTLTPLSHAHLHVSVFELRLLATSIRRGILKRNIHALIRPGKREAQGEFDILQRGWQSDQLFSFGREPGDLCYSVRSEGAPARVTPGV